MTLEQIRKMTDREIDRAIEQLLPDRGKPFYSTDLNAAMSLVPQGSGMDETDDFHVALQAVGCVTMNSDSVEDWWFYQCSNKPRALCEAYLLWKAGDK